jgi:hypothetical protein
MPASGLERPPYQTQDRWQFAKGDMQQRIGRNDAIIAFRSVKLVEPHDPDRTPQPGFGLDGHFWHAIGRIDMVAQRLHVDGIASRTAAELKNPTAGRETLQKPVEVAADPARSACGIVRRLSRVEFKRLMVKRRHGSHFGKSSTV